MNENFNCLYTPVFVPNLVRVNIRIVLRERCIKRVKRIASRNTATLSTFKYTTLY